MRPNNAGNTQVIGVVAVLLMLAGAVGWLLMGSSSDDTDGGSEDPVVEAGDEQGDPSAGTFDPTESNSGATPDVQDPERTEVLPEGGRAAASSAGGVRGSVVDENGGAIAGAQIFLSPRAGSQIFSSAPAAATPEEKARLKDQTAKDGRYYFAELPAGKEFELWVHHPDYGSESGPPVVVLGSEIQELGPIVLRSGYALTGTVTDTAGNPLPATVEFYMQDMNFLRSGTAEDLRAKDAASGRLKIVGTDGNGQFRVEHLGQGIWSAQAYSEGFASNIVRAITMLDGNDPQPILIELDTEHLITGIVVTPDGTPIPGARVQVARVKPRPVIAGGTDSGEDGSFIVDRLPAGSYGVLVMMPGYSNQRVGRTEAGGDPLRIVLVVKAHIRGRVVAPDGAPIPSFSLELLSPMRGKTQYRKLGKVFPFENPNGDFVITDADPTEYVILARAPGFAATYSAPFIASRNEGGEGSGIIDIVMKNGATITGQVIDGVSGNGVPGVEVSLHMADYQVQEGDSMFGDVFQDLGNIPGTKVRTDASGMFRIDNAYVDRMTLVASKDGFLPATMAITTATGRLLDVGRLEMRPGGTISGTATGPDGKPLVGGTVNLTRPGDPFQRRATLDSRGRFSFGSLRSGQYELIAFPPSDPNTFLFPDESSKQQVFVDEGRTKTVDLKVKTQ